ncbi:MAG: response regulator [Planctomycetota bacterium]
MVRTPVRWLGFLLLLSVWAATPGIGLAQAPAAAVRASPEVDGDGSACSRCAAPNPELAAAGFGLLFDTRDFPQRWHCGTWSATHGWVHIVSDLLIWLAYLSIPVALWWVARRRPDVPFRHLFLLFGSFIVACGLTHFLEALLFWWPAYRLLGLVKVGTAVVSVLTAVVLVRVLPDVLALRTPAALEREVAERTRALQHSEENLRAAKREAERANRLKGEFLANMSHEIRTPLTAVLGYASLVLEESNDPAARDSARTIHDNGEHLLGILNDILDVSKIEAGKLEFDRKTIAVQSIVDSCMDLFRAKAEEKGIALRCTVDVHVPPRVYTDGMRVKQVLLNLIGNAVKFTSRGTVELRVFVASDRSPGDTEARIVFDVIDTGIGLDSSAKSRIFEPFVQAESTLSRRFGGTGLGLTISSCVAHGLGGELILVSSEEGVGSHFRFELPMRLDRVREQPLPTSDSGAEGNGLRDLDVVLAEDAPDSHRLIAHFLTKTGARVTSAYDGEQVVEIVSGRLLRNDPPHLIVMDMQMPKLDGYEATKAIRDLGYDGPILALTAHAMEDHRARCLASGCNAFESKPIQRQRLTAAISALLEEQRQRPAEQT